MKFLLISVIAVILTRKVFVEVAQVNVDNQLSTEEFVPSMSMDVDTKVTVLE